MTAVRNDSNDYVTRVLDSPLHVGAEQWNALVDRQESPGPFMRHEYLAALECSGSATPAAGWTPRFVTLWRDEQLLAACPLYLKSHSYGEYVFDWAWAHAYEQHGVDYYPKAVVAVPFTPVAGARLLARDDAARRGLLEAAVAWCRKERLSSLHLLFAREEDAGACAAAGLMIRHTVQFHWANRGWTDFDAFMSSLAHDKRKKIRQERRKVADEGVSFRCLRGREIEAADWDFFYRCYERTYYEHGSAPYLTRDFFHRVAQDMPGNWLLFLGERGGKRIAASLIAIDAGPGSPATKVAYGRYWGALQRVDCLHFEACYYQPLQWCIEHGYGRFEGGAQGEHKMARALMPVKTTSAHWLAHPAFADAVDRFLEREGEGVGRYLERLERRSPFRHA
jgi:uncharacterized protein